MNSKNLLASLTSSNLITSLAVLALAIFLTILILQPNAITETFSNIISNPPNYIYSGLTFETNPALLKDVKTSKITGKLVKDPSNLLPHSPAELRIEGMKTEYADTVKYNYYTKIYHVLAQIHKNNTDCTFFKGCGKLEVGDKVDVNYGSNGSYVVTELNQQ